MFIFNLFHEHRAVELVPGNTSCGNTSYCSTGSFFIKCSWKQIYLVWKYIDICIYTIHILLHNICVPIVLIIEIVVVCTMYIRRICSHIASLCLIDLECNWNWWIARVASACTVYPCVSVRSVYWSNIILDKSLKLQKTGSSTAQIHKARRHTTQVSKVKSRW